MTSLRESHSHAGAVIGLTIAAALMASAPIGAAYAAGPGAAGAASGGAGVGNGVGGNAGEGQAASNGSGYEPSETDCVTVAQAPGRYAPDDLAACGITAPVYGYGYYRGRS